jgi:uncharacterized RDD family membrane protein YckC
MLCRNHVDVAEGVRRCARCGTPFCPDCLIELSGRPYCGTCKAEQLLDVRSGVDRSQLQLASTLKRFGALFIDNIITLIPCYIIMFMVLFWIGTGAQKNPNPNPPIGLLFLIYIPFFVFPFLYEGLMLSMKDGQSIGKMVLRLRVVRPDGSPIAKGQGWGRSAMRVVLSVLSFIEYLPAFFTKERTTLHDMVAGTRVVEIL